MAIKKFKKSKVKETAKTLPTFHIVKWMRKGKETYRYLIDDKYHHSWSALSKENAGSVAEANRLRSWASDYKDSTFNYMLQIRNDVVPQGSIDKQKFILETVLQEPYLYIDGELTYMYEPSDPDLLDQIREIQDEYLAELKAQQQREKEELEAQEKERARKEKVNKLRNKLRRRFA